MLESLEIKNYKNLKELKLDSLGMVNLITGRNNTGKSSLLEAISVYATKGDFKNIYRILQSRGEFLSKKEEQYDFTESNVKSLSTLFFNRHVSFNPQDAILIRDFVNVEKKNSNDLTLRFAKIQDKKIVGKDGSVSIFVEEVDGSTENVTIETGFIVHTGIEHTIPLESDKYFRNGFHRIEKEENLQFIPTTLVEESLNAILYDNIVLGTEERYVIETLKIIDPSIEKLAFLNEENKRTAVVKLSDQQSRVPLRSMGDGINRILTIILALVNAENGYLLIDEFENGLHYSVQEQLWKIIFELSGRLNVQVFATTHSQDSIQAFQAVLAAQANPSSGKLIRLDNVNGVIREVSFDAHELKIATDNAIEVR